MIRADQIPDEVFYAFQKAWTDQSTLSTKECLAAAINSWPGAEWRESGHYPNGTSGPDATVTKRIILPLPQDASDE